MYFHNSFPEIISVSELNLLKAYKKLKSSVISVTVYFGMLEKCTEVLFYISHVTLTGKQHQFCLTPITLYWAVKLLTAVKDKEVLLDSLERPPVNVLKRKHFQFMTAVTSLLALSRDQPWITQRIVKLEDS